MTRQIQPKLATVAEVADVLRVSRMTVYRMIHAGELPAVRFAKSFRIPLDAVNQIIENSMHEVSDSEDTALGG